MMEPDKWTALQLASAISSATISAQLVKGAVFSQLPCRNTVTASSSNTAVLVVTTSRYQLTSIAQIGVTTMNTGAMTDKGARVTTAIPMRNSCRPVNARAAAARKPPEMEETAKNLL